MTRTETAAGRTIPRADGRAWLRWGAAVAVGDAILHTGGGVLINDWEGWGRFLENLLFPVVTALIALGLVYGLWVRWGLKESRRERNRPALAGLPLAVLSVASFGAFFTWAPLLLSPGAVLLGREGLARAQEGYGGRRLALTAVSLGLTSFAFGAFLIVYALLNRGELPFGF